MKNLFNTAGATLRMALWVVLSAAVFTACSTSSDTHAESTESTHAYYDADAPLDLADGTSKAVLTSSGGAATRAKKSTTATLSIAPGTEEAGGGFGIRAGRADKSASRTVTETVGKVTALGAASTEAKTLSLGSAAAPIMASGVVSGETYAHSEREALAYREAEPGEYAVVEKDEMVSDDGSDRIDPITDTEIEPEPAPRAGQLTAGEWSDLAEWKFWNSVIASSDWSKMVEHWGFGKGQRISVRVDNGSQPIPDAEVQLLDKDGALLWTSRTDNFGRAELFTGLDRENENGPYEVVARAGGQETSLGGVDPSREQSPSESPLFARLRLNPEQINTVDVMFVVDATGSMGDELNYIKAELESVIERVQTEMENAYTIRVASNVYRDQGDEYVVRSHPFSENVRDVAMFLRSQRAGGGGDTPEAVEEALEDAIDKHQWSASAQSRFLFLVLDAPPHYTPERLEKIRELTRKAAAKGIRVIPVSGSGVDKETEFLMRFMAIHTGGTYVFLTDHSGIGESHIEPTIGNYAVEYLDDLIVRLIVQYTRQPESIDAITPRKPDIH